jgi:hypothetical protein
VWFAVKAHEVALYPALRWQARNTS